MKTNIEEIIKSCDTLEITIIKNKDNQYYKCVIGDGNHITESMLFDDAINYVREFYRCLLNYNEDKTVVEKQ